MTWETHAACRGMDPDLFFPGQGESTREARMVCSVCPVRSQCLESALASGEKYGIFGGKSERERRRLRRLRETGAPEAAPEAVPAPALIKRASRRRPPPPPCGTYPGYKRHLNDKNTPCAECRRANADHRLAWVRRQREERTG